MYIILKMLQTDIKIGEIIKKRRLSIPMTLYELSNGTGVSQSHIGRIERGERLPSAHVLRKIAKPLGFEEDELFTRAGYLSPQASTSEREPGGTVGLDPYVARVLSQEPVQVQHTVIGILSILKSLAKSGKKAILVSLNIPVFR